MNNNYVYSKGYIKMKALSVEQSILDGEKELKELFKYVETDTKGLKAYDMEKEIFARIMRIGSAAMKCYFAEKGTGDIGAESPLDNGAIDRHLNNFKPAKAVCHATPAQLLSFFITQITLAASSIYFLKTFTTEARMSSNVGKNLQ